MAAIGYTHTGDADQADTAYKTALAAYSALGDLQNAAQVSSDWGYALVIRQELPRAALQLERALEYARQMNNRRLQARVLSNLAAVYQARGDLRQAQDQLAAALEIARQLHWQRVEAEILIGRAENALVLEGPQAALSLYEECGKLTARVNSGHVYSGAGRAGLLFAPAGPLC